MIVPHFWAEARVQQKAAKKQIIVRRYGWSDTSQFDAQTNAEARAQEAMLRIQSGEKLPRREPKVPYNGADGVPIREEILSTHGDSVVTRNIYGAACLNTPNVFFADVDYRTEYPGLPACGVGGALVIAGLAIGGSTGSGFAGILVIVLGIVIGRMLASQSRQRFETQSEERRRDSLAKIRAFSQLQPHWHLRLYATPAGYRILAMHDVFDPADERMAGWFEELGTDPVYARMCLNQRCFRARVSPKPWRVGIEQHIRPRPGVWPIKPERMEDRRNWVAAYELKAANFASCTFMETLGSSTVHPAAQAVQVLHDDLARAASGLPTA